MRVALLPLVGPPGVSESASPFAGEPEIGSSQYSPAACCCWRRFVFFGAGKAMAILPERAGRG